MNLKKKRWNICRISRMSRHSEKQMLWKRLRSNKITCARVCDLVYPA